MSETERYTIDDARADAREWIKGMTVHDGSRGWRVCCALLEGRIAELEAICRSQQAMLDEIANAAGFGVGDAYSAQAIIRRLSGDVR